MIPADDTQDDTPYDTPDDTLDATLAEGYHISLDYHGLSSGVVRLLSAGKIYSGDIIFRANIQYHLKPYVHYLGGISSRMRVSFGRRVSSGEEGNH
jgi:hypothetical protein